MTTDAATPNEPSTKMDTFLKSQLAKSKEALMQERLKYRNPKSDEAIALNALLKATIRNKTPITNLSDAKAIYRLERQSIQYRIPLQEALKRHEMLQQFDGAHYAMLLMQSEMVTQTIQEPLAIKRKRQLEESIEEAEIVPPIAELADQHAEIAKTIGELAEQSDRFHHLSHLSDSSAATLRSAGGIGAVVAGVLALFINGYRCLREKRMPDSFEKAKMTYSAIILSLGVLALTGVGGPVAVTAFGASAIFLSFSKTLFEVIRDGYRLKAAKTARDATIQERKTLIEDIKATVLQCQEIKNTLQHSPSHPDAAKLERQFLTALETLKKQEAALQSNNKRFAFNVYKHQILEERQQSISEKVRKIGLIIGGVLSVVGAALSFSPIAPIGLLLTGAGAVLSLFVEGGYRLHKYIQNKNEEKFLKQSDALKLDSKELDDWLPEEEAFASSDSLLLKKLGATEPKDHPATASSPTPSGDPTAPGSDNKPICNSTPSPKASSLPESDPDDGESESVHPK